jgi:antitoxin (DNA-binding transcriptional repressor) of toxin-antitoxin stability system
MDKFIESRCYFLTRRYKMEIVTILTAKATLAKLLARVEAGEEIVLARGKKPIASDQAPLRGAARRHQRRTGFFRTVAAAGTGGLGIAAAIENLMLVSNAHAFDAYGVARLW